MLDGDLEEQIDEGSEPVWPARRWNTIVLDECVEGDKVRFYVDLSNGSGGSSEMKSTASRSSGAEGSSC